jgi:hypothetical protein
MIIKDLPHYKVPEGPEGLNIYRNNNNNHKSRRDATGILIEKNRTRITNRNSSLAISLIRLS